MERITLEKILYLIAEVVSETTSMVGFHEPKTPDKLLKKNNNKEK